MRSWPWPSTSSTSPPLQNDHSDTEESPYEMLQIENIKEKEKRLADLGIASEVKSVKKTHKRKTKTSSSEPIGKSTIDHCIVANLQKYFKYVSPSLYG